MSVRGTLSPLLLTTALLTLALDPSVGDGIALEWTAPPQCPQQAAVRAAIDLNLARETFGDQLHTVTVQGSIEPTADGWVLHVRTELPGGTMQRDVHSDVCDELADAAGLIIAVALDPLRVLHAAQRNADPAPDDVLSPPEPPSPARTEPEPEPDEPPPLLDEPATPPPAEPARRRPSFDLRLGVLGEIGSLDVARVGAWAGLGVVAKHVRFDLAAQYWGPRRLLPFEQTPAAGVVVQQGGVAGRGCLIPVHRPLEFASCVGVEAGLARGAGVGLGSPRVTRAPWVAMVIGQEVSWTSDRRIGVWIAADAMLHLVRPRWTIRELGVAAHTRPVGFRLVVGPTVRI